MTNEDGMTIGGDDKERMEVSNDLATATETGGN